MQDLSKLFHLVLDNIPARVFIKDTNLVYRWANELFVHDAGLSSVDELIGKTDLELTWTDKQATKYRRDDKVVINSGKPKLNIEEPQDQIDGSVHWLQTNKIPLKGKNGNIIGVLGVYNDITDQKNQHLQIERQARYDLLTNLPNRLYLEECLTNVHRVHQQIYSSLMFIDLDHFKSINDSLGHHVGDQLLIQVAQRLKTVIGKKGVITRLGGDEFSALLYLDYQQINNKRAAQEMAESILDSFIKPFNVDEHILYLEASIGITMLNSERRSASSLFREADTAMYSAKSQGRNTYSFYNQVMQDKSKQTNNLIMNLRHAIKREEFNLYYQPQYDQNQRCIGVEALIRWNDKQSGFVSPAQFIPIAEKTGLIHPIGEWVMKESAQALTRWREQFSFNGRMSINISAEQFRQSNFISLIAEWISTSQLPPESFELEITESLLLGNEDSALDKLNKLKSLGFSIALDDFGTGYSSLSYLSRLPVDKLKIDRSFVTRMFEHHHDQSIVTTILQMAQNLGIQTVAEGVEDPKELSFLIENGCDIFQGYYLAKPMSEDDLITAIK